MFDVHVPRKPPMLRKLAQTSTLRKPLMSYDCIGLHTAQTSDDLSKANIGGLRGAFLLECNIVADRTAASLFIQP